MARSRLLVAPLVLAGGIALTALARDPFTPAFDAGLLLSAAGLVALPGLVARRLVGRPGFVLRAAGWAIAAILVFGVGAGVVLLTDYRMVAFRRADAAMWRADLVDLDGMLDRLPARLRARAAEVTRPALAKFMAASDGQSEDARHAALAAVIATLDDGHSVYFPPFPASSLALVPLQLRFFDDGLFVTHGGGRHHALAGSRVVSIAGLPVEDAYARIAPLVSADNEPSRRQRAPLYMLSPRLWAALGAGTSDALDLEIADRAGARRTLRVRPANRLKYLYWYLDPLRAERDPWTVEHRADAVALVVTLRRIADNDGETLGAFGARVVAEARRQGVRRLVFDVRGNQGGDNTLLPPLVDALAVSEYNRPDGLVVLTGPATFSAATNFVSLMEARTRATRVGGPTGSGPNHHGDSNHVVLPRTGAVLFLSTRWHAFGRPDDTRRAHEPHVRVPDLSGDYFAGRDRALETALVHGRLDAPLRAR